MLLKVQPTANIYFPNSKKIKLSKNCLQIIADHQYLKYANMRLILHTSGDRLSLEDRCKMKRENGWFLRPEDARRCR